MNRMSITRPMRLALSSLGALALVVGCAPAPSVTSPQASVASPARPLAVQGVLVATVERVGFEPSPYHEVKLTPDDYFEPFAIVPLAERASITADGLYGLVPDPEDPHRFTRADSPDAEGVTHVGYYPDWKDNYGSDLVAERGGVEAARVGYDGNETVRLAFSQATSGPLTVKSKTPTMGFITWGDETTSIYRQHTFGEDRISPFEGARDTVIVFSVMNTAGEPINGLTKDFVRLSLSDLVDEGYWGTFEFETLEALGDGKYQIREPFNPYYESGRMRIQVEVVNPDTPINATFYRR
jgi:hypothetical protein